MHLTDSRNAIEVPPQLRRRTLGKVTSSFNKEQEKIDIRAYRCRIDFAHALVGARPSIVISTGLFLLVLLLISTIVGRVLASDRPQFHVDGPRRVGNEVHQRLGQSSQFLLLVGSRRSSGNSDGLRTDQKGNKQCSRRG